MRLGEPTPDTMCRAQINVYLPDELAENARLAGLNVSALTQAAAAAELQRRGTDAWLAILHGAERRAQPPSGDRRTRHAPRRAR